MSRIKIILVLCPLVLGILAVQIWRSEEGSFYSNCTGVLLVKAFRESAESSSFWPLTSYTQGSVAFQELETYASKGASLRPDNAAASYLLARVELLLGRRQIAEEVLGRIPGFSSRGILVNASLGWLAWQNGLEADALEYFRKAPGVEISLANQARAWLESAAHSQQGSALYRTVFSLQPKVASVYYDYAEALARMGRFEDALAVHEQGRPYESDQKVFHERRAALGIAARRLDLAVADYRALVELEPSKVFYWYRLGDLYRDQNRYEEALLAYQRGAKNDRESALLHIRLGTVYAQMGQIETAVLEMERAVALEPTNYRAHYELGQVLLGFAQEPEAALSAYLRAHQLAPGEMWPCLGVGEAYRLLFKYDEAASWLLKARDMAPLRPEPVYLLGMNYLSQRRPEEAIPFLKDAVAFGPMEGRYYRYLGEALMQSGDVDAAILVYERWLEIEPFSDYVQQKLNEWRGHQSSRQ